MENVLRKFGGRALLYRAPMPRRNSERAYARLTGIRLYVEMFRHINITSIA
jgi:hypothetical protein